jgi:hypothetical protein
VTRFADRHGLRFTVWTFVFAFALWDTAPVTNPVLREVLFWVRTVSTWVGVPVLLTLAWTGWIGSVRPGMAVWRNGLGLTALVITSLHWGFVALLIAVALVRLCAEVQPGLIDQDYMPDYIGYVAKSMQLGDLVAIVLAVALRRAPRIQVIVESILMFAGGRGSI